ncbi:RNA polymerase recycling motor ATPase HelR [Microbacterium sp. zg-YB36]|uniref:RNA polymerase recycling motor ATPase HelR n=1 Tax=Microbacterium sp. zg-YB36 TaxID=2969407 RepID=UPI00214C92D3|nr:RNA polymerase recycling motor ATPase HelR [Microbacterium sp. zg-YB36]MDL5351085.1 RNA polymerase recycling motor ATPase HelR [Microbacterium sp. zg-YB36]
MSPATVNAFHLPERLAMKADAALIAADEAHFTRIAETLQLSRARATARLDAMLNAPGGKGQAALERDLEIHRINSQLTTLRRFGLDMCLGRLVASDGSAPLYIGRMGLTGEDGHPLLVDWRTPAAEPFFAATHADPMGLVSRRRYRWAGGRVIDYWDEVFTADGVEATAAVDEQSAFLAGLGGARTSRMRDVLATIRADQDAIIRAGSRGALVVDGGPGTGKTVVALHRAAYLLYADSRITRGSGGGVLVVGPHQPYLAYVEDVLPSLGEDRVQLCTLRDLVAEGATALPEADARVASIKADGRLVDAIDNAVRLYEQPPLTAIVVETDWDDVRLTPDEWADAMDAEPGQPHNDARDEVWDALLGILTAKSDIPAAHTRQVLAQNDALARAFHRVWPVLDPRGLVATLWTDADFLRRCAPWLSDAEVLLLQRDDGRAWTASDLPFLDAAHQRIGDPGAGRVRRRREAALAAEREYRADIADYLMRSSDDDLGLMSILHGEDAQNSLDDHDALPRTSPDLLAGPFAHVIVDEAQELTDAEWRMLLSRCPSRSFTVVGDRAQARHGFTQSWPERLTRAGLKNITVSELTINYRTPAEIMAEAEQVIRAAVPNANVPTSVRTGGVPVRRGTRSELETIVASWLAENEEGTACVIGDPTFASSARVQSLTPELSKGLEFDLVVLVDPHRFGEGIEGVVDHYVAMTRATRGLVVLEG